MKKLIDYINLFKENRSEIIFRKICKIVDVDNFKIKNRYLSSDEARQEILVGLWKALIKIKKIKKNLNIKSYLRKAIKSYLLYLIRKNRKLISRHISTENKENVLTQQVNVDYKIVDVLMDIRGMLENNDFRTLIDVLNGKYNSNTYKKIKRPLRIIKKSLKKMKENRDV